MIFIIGTVFVLICLWCIFINSQPPNTPPGPFVWPIIGNLGQLAFASSNPLLAISNLSRKYGPIYRLKMGMKDVVVVASKSAIESISKQEEMLGRDMSGMLYDRCRGQNTGIGFSTGELWKKTRSWTFNNLKDLGFGKTQAMEHFVGEEIEKLFRRIDSETSGIMEAETLFLLHLMTISYQMMTSSSMSHEDKKRISQLTETGHLFTTQDVFGFGIVNSFPFVRYIFPGITGKNIAEKGFSTSENITNKLLQEAIVRVKDGKSCEASLPDLFARKMVEEKEIKDSIFFEENFNIVFQDIAIASTDTSNGILQNSLLQLCLNRNIQEKLFKEIETFGYNIDFSELRRMPYMQAFNYELFRMTNVSPNLLPRKATKDFMFENYFIKEGTLVVPDMVYCYSNEHIWENPSKFNPDRFCYNKENGEFVGSKNLIPFGTGPRKCPGELHGMMTLFLFLTQIIKHYALSIPVGDPQPRSDMKPGMSLKPYGFRVQFINRN